MNVNLPIRATYMHLSIFNVIPKQLSRKKLSISARGTSPFNFSRFNISFETLINLQIHLFPPKQVLAKFINLSPTASPNNDKLSVLPFETIIKIVVSLTSRHRHHRRASRTTLNYCRVQIVQIRVQHPFSPVSAVETSQVRFRQ